MITRKRVRVTEGDEPETKSLDRTQQASYEQICSESGDSTELDLDDFLSVDDLNWNFDQEGLSSIFDLGTTVSSDVSSTVANRGRTDPGPDELFSSLKRSGGVKKTQECKRSLPGRVNKNAIAARMNRLKKKVDGIMEFAIPFEAGKMGKCKDLSDFDKGQIVMARRLGQNISKTAALVGCSRSAVVSTYQKWSKEGKAVNRRQM